MIEAKYLAMPFARRAYRKPPIEQAICEIKFSPSLEWDWTIPGILYEQIKADFPVKKQAQSLEFTLNPKELSLVQEFKGAAGPMQFLRPDHSEMVQVGPDLLSMHVISSYRNWESFFARISSICTLYQKITTPKGIQRVGLRYVNRIGFQETAFELTDYFNYYPHLPETMEQAHGPFLLGVLFPYNNGRDYLNAKMATVTKGFTLDLDYYLAKPNAVEIGDLPEWISGAHEKIEQMFESCITEKTRSMFDPVEAR